MLDPLYQNKSFFFPFNVYDKVSKFAFGKKECLNLLLVRKSNVLIIGYDNGNVM